MGFLYWLGLNVSAAAQTYGLRTVVVVVASPFVAGAALFVLSVVASGRR